MSYDRQTKPHCSSCKPIFYLLDHLGELPKHESEQLEKHKLSCAIGLEYSFRVSEIMSGVKYQSGDKEIGAMEILSTEVWQLKESKLTDRVLSEVLEKLESTTRHKEIMDIIQSTPDALENSRKIEVLDSRVGNLENGQAAIFKELKSIRMMVVIFSLSIISISILIFLILGLPAFHKQKLIATKPSNYINSTKITSSPNLYEALDIAIDNYLSGQSGIVEAENIATQIKRINNDNYGVDLVGYYKAVSPEVNSKLLTLRRELLSLEKNSFGNDIATALDRVEYIRQNFFLLGDIIEGYRAKVLLIKYSILTANTKSLNGLLSESESWAKSSNYLFLELQILLWKSKDMRESSPRATIENVVKLASALGAVDTQISAAISLAGIYVNKEENQKALELIGQILTLKPTKTSHKVTILQVQGLAYFKLKQNELSLNCFNEAINVSLREDNRLLAALSYSFLATTLSQVGEYSDCEAALKETEKLVNAIDSLHHKTEITARIKGYQAKNEYLQGNYYKAIELYKESIVLTESLEMDMSGELTDLNNALGDTLKRIGDRNYLQYHQVAKYHSKKTLQQQDLFNCVLSFAVACN